MANGILQDVLTEEQRNAGLYLEEDEDFLYLYDKERNRRAVFSSVGATLDSVRAEAGRILASQSG